jgi:hypothetical protein
MLGAGSKSMIPAGSRGVSSIKKGASFVSPVAPVKAKKPTVAASATKTPKRAAVPVVMARGGALLADSEEEEDMDQPYGDEEEEEEDVDAREADGAGCAWMISERLETEGS